MFYLDGYLTELPKVDLCIKVSNYPAEQAKYAHFQFYHNSAICAF